MYLVKKKHMYKECKKMHDFLIFYAPILVVIVSIGVAIMAALNTKFL